MPESERPVVFPLDSQAGEGRREAHLLTRSDSLAVTPELYLETEIDRTLDRRAPVVHKA